MVKTKVLNLYAGIGGNRKLWKNVQVTAVELNPKIAAEYQKNFPDDKVVVGDAHEYLRLHHQEYDVIWSSRPCITHSRIRKYTAGDRKGFEPVYPDMGLYEEIIFLQHYFKGKWVVENVIPYYEPLIKPQVRGRHCFWANFIIPEKNMPVEIPNTYHRHKHKIDKNTYFPDAPRQLRRNAVHPKLGLHIFNAALNEPQQTLR